MPKFQNAANLKLQKYIIRRKYWWHLRDCMQSAEAWAQSPIFSWHSQRLACDVSPPSVGFFSDSVCFRQLKRIQKESPVHMQNLASSLLPWSARPYCILFGSRCIGHVWTFSQFLSPKSAKIWGTGSMPSCWVLELVEDVLGQRVSSDSFHTQNLWLEKVKYGTLVQAPPPFQQQCDLSVELATTFHQGDTTQVRRRRNSCSACCSFPWSLAKHCQVGHKCLQVIFSQTESRTAKHSAKLLRQCKVSAWPGLGHQRDDFWFCQKGSSSKSPHEQCGFFQGPDPNDRRKMQRPSQCKSMSNHRQDKK